MKSEQFYKKIKSFGLRNGLSPEDSEDLASYSTIYFLQGRKASYKQYYVDFMRKRFGNKRSPNFELQRNVNHPTQEFRDDFHGEIDEYLERSLDLKQAIDSLSSKEKHLVYLKHHLGHTAKEIAELMNVSRKTIWDRLKIIYGKLRIGL